MQKEINFYQEMASGHRLQEYSKGPVPLFFVIFQCSREQYRHPVNSFNLYLKCVPFLKHNSLAGH